MMCDGRKWVDAREVLEVRRDAESFEAVHAFQAAIPLHDRMRKELPRKSSRRRGVPSSNTKCVECLMSPG